MNATASFCIIVFLIMAGRAAVLFKGGKASGGDMEKRDRIKCDRQFFRLMCSLNFMITAWLFSAGISGNDFWWHVKAGEWIVEHGSIPSADVFSWLSRGSKLVWVPHEWLSQVVFYILFCALGEAGILICAMLAALLLNFSAMALRRGQMGRNQLYWGVYFLYTAFLLGQFCCGRPQIFSFVLMWAEMALLYGFIDRPEGRGIYWIPPIAALWSNFHGGSSNLSYLLVLAVLGSGILRFSTGRLEAGGLPAKSLARLVCVFAASVLGIFINPVGRRIFLYPYEQMWEGDMLKYISEWAAPDVKNPVQLVLFFVPVFLTVMPVLLSAKRIRLNDCIFMLFFLYLFFRSVRFTALYLLAAPFWASDYVDGIPKEKKREPKEKYRWTNRIFAWAVTGMAVAAGLAGLFEAGRNAAEGTGISRVLPEGILEVARRENPERLFNDYNYGGELIFAGIPVFYDGRADIYTAAGIFSEGNSLMYLKRTEGDGEGFYPEVLMEKYRFDGILIGTDRPLYAYLNSRPEWFLKIREEEGAAYYRVIKTADSGPKETGRYMGP